MRVIFLPFEKYLVTFGKLGCRSCNYNRTYIKQSLEFLGGLNLENLVFQSESNLLVDFGHHFSFSHYRNDFDDVDGSRFAKFCFGNFK